MERLFCRKLVLKKLRAAMIDGRKTYDIIPAGGVLQSQQTAAEGDVTLEKRTYLLFIDFLPPLYSMLLDGDLELEITSVKGVYNLEQQLIACKCMTV